MVSPSIPTLNCGQSLHPYSGLWSVPLSLYWTVVSASIPTLDYGQSLHPHTGLWSAPPSLCWTVVRTSKPSLDCGQSLHPYAGLGPIFPVLQMDLGTSLSEGKPCRRKGRLIDRNDPGWRGL